MTQRISREQFKNEFGGNLSKLKEKLALKPNTAREKVSKLDIMQGRTRVDRVELTLPYPPTLNNLYVNKKTGGRMLSEKGKEYKKVVASTCSLQKVGYIEGDIKLEVKAYRPQKRGDLDNVLKILQDSIQGICYRNDEQICEIHALRFDDAKNPRVELVLTEYENF